jgi:hypothetical protein
LIYAEVDTKTKEILKYPVDPLDVRKWAGQNGMSLPVDISTVDLTSFGWYQVDYIIPPPLETPGHKVVLDTPIWQNDVLLRTYKEIPRTEKETKVLWNKIRTRRNKLLENSDWVELSSLAKQKPDEWKEAWAIYRTELRDITSSIDPEMVEWPTPPEN